MGGCTIANGGDFVLTHDGDVLYSEKDLYNKDTDCYNCSKEVKEKCKKELISLITGKVIEDIDATALINKYKQDEKNARSDLQIRNDKRRINTTKKHR